MSRTLFILSVIFLVQSQVLAQSEELPKFEVAGEFTTLEREAFPGRRTEPGLGRASLTILTKCSALKRRLLLSEAMFSVSQWRKCRGRSRRSESRKALREVGHLRERTTGRD
jgi:hypothetical protein